MHSIWVDLLLFGSIYGMLLGILFYYKKKSKGKNNDESDDDGGLPFFTPPKLDLPPGICLPGGPDLLEKENEEVLS